jgi:hypothetical protein
VPRRIVGISSLAARAGVAARSRSAASRFMTTPA